MDLFRTLNNSGYQEEETNRLLSKAEAQKYAEQKNINESISIEYDVNLSHLTDLKLDDFRKWINAMDVEHENILDTLYKVFPLPKSDEFFTK